MYVRSLGHLVLVFLYCTLLCPVVALRMGDAMLFLVPNAQKQKKYTHKETKKKNHLTKGIEKEEWMAKRVGKGVGLEVLCKRRNPRDEKKEMRDSGDTGMGISGQGKKKGGGLGKGFVGQRKT